MVEEGDENLVASYILVMKYSPTIIYWYFINLI